MNSSGHASSEGREHRDRVAARLALSGAALGVVAGLVELTAGPSIRDWVGNKQDTTRLGLTTTLLALVAAFAAAALRRPAGAAAARRIAVILGLTIPGLVCFTTVGRLWYLPGVLLLAAAAILLIGTTRGEFAAAFTQQHWRVTLLAVCGAYYAFLGATALGSAGLLGILGGALLWIVPAVSKRSHKVAYVILLVGALPFAVATWWSVVTPLVAILAIWFGQSVIRHTRGTEDLPGRAPGTSLPRPASLG